MFRENTYSLQISLTRFRTIKIAKRTNQSSFSIESSITNQKYLYYRKYFYQYYTQLKQKFVNQRSKQKLMNRHIKSLRKMGKKEL